MITMIELPGFGEDREMADLRARIEKAEADLTTERTRVRLHGESLDKMRAQRDALAERVKVLEAERDEAIGERDEWLSAARGRRERGRVMASDTKYEAAKRLLGKQRAYIYTMEREHGEMRGALCTVAMERIAFGGDLSVADLLARIQDRSGPRPVAEVFESHGITPHPSMDEVNRITGKRLGPEDRS